LMSAPLAIIQAQVHAIPMRATTSDALGIVGSAESGVRTDAVGVSVWDVPAGCPAIFENCPKIL
jgi:hypothetical protein